MKVSRFTPKPPPSFTLTFSQDEGWALVMALTDAYDKYTDASDRKEWKQWAEDLNRELRRD